MLPISRELGKAIRASAICFKAADLSMLNIIGEDMKEDIAYRGNYRETSDSCTSAGSLDIRLLEYKCHSQESKHLALIIRDCMKLPLTPGILCIVTGLQNDIQVDKSHRETHLD